MRVFGCPPAKRAEFQGFGVPWTLTRRHREQSRADLSTGHADQDVQGRGRPGDRGPVRRQGHHRRRAQEGRQGADHRLRELRSPQARGAHGSQSQDGRRDSDQSVDRPRVSRRQAAEAGGEQEISRKAQAASHGSPRWAARRLLMKRRLLVLARSCAALAGVALLVAPPRGTVRVERFFAPALGVEKHYVVYLPPSCAAPALCVVQARYEDYIARDLVRHVDSTYRTLADRRHRGIAGLSMGGFGAVTIALAHPDVFSAAASHSGVLSPLYAGPHPFAAPAHYHMSIDSLAADWRGIWGAIAPAFGRTIASWTARDPAQLVRRLAAARGPMPALFIDVGTQDRLLDQARAFHAELA